ncbi:MAG TPA: flagellar basal body rod C-terminal domain-containing protein [Bryobacteraceae bacterium]|nr:flagellar basal body rod C-terminal domain-containing protein [Bryobacteraceae bacterium]
MEVTYTALGGLRQAENQLDRTASVLARSPFSTAGPQDEVSLSDAAVSMLQAENSYRANLGAIKVADEMQKSTLSLLG